MAKKPLLIGNWKLNHSRKSASQFLSLVLEQKKSFAEVDLGIAPVAPMLDFLGQGLRNSAIALAAQNVFYQEKGAFTGEWSCDHLAELGVKYCIVGHSERRTIFFETDEMVAKKSLACLNKNITPVICVGESQEERDQGRSTLVVENQVNAVLDHIAEQTQGDIVFAYEPIWAIGTGKTASATEAEEIHQHIFELASKKLDKTRLDAMKIIYGGSVNAQNIREIVAMPHIDGALVGGASLQAQTFLSMVEAFR